MDEKREMFADEATTPPVAGTSNPSIPSSHSVSAAGMSEQDLDRARLVEQACEARDIDTLIQLGGSPPGFVTHTLRRIAWPILLGAGEERQGGEEIDNGEKRESKGDVSDGNNREGDSEGQDNEKTGTQGQIDEKKPGDHRDEEQVRLDVNRSLRQYVDVFSKSEMEAKREDLQDIIMRVLRRHPDLFYYQGFHDIAQVVLMVYGGSVTPQSVAVLDRITVCRTRDFMLPTFDGATDHLDLLLPIVAAANKNLARGLSAEYSFFAIAPVITLFSHHVTELDQIAVLFDFLLTQGPDLSIYLYAQLLLDNEKILMAEFDSHEPEINSILTNLAAKPFEFATVFAKTLKLRSSHPLKTLRSYTPPSPTPRPGPSSRRLRPALSIVDPRHLLNSLLSLSATLIPFPSLRVWSNINPGSVLKRSSSVGAIIEQSDDDAMASYHAYRESIEHREKPKKSMMDRLLGYASVVLPLSISSGTRTGRKCRLLETVSSKLISVTVAIAVVAVLYSWSKKNSY